MLYIWIKCLAGTFFSMPVELTVRENFRRNYLCKSP